MWNDFSKPPADSDGVGSKQEVVVYWPAYFPDGSHLSVHVVDYVPTLLALPSPPTKWAVLDPIAEDTQPPTPDTKAAAMAALIAQVDAAGGDSSVLTAIAADAGLVLPAQTAQLADAQSAQVKAP